MKNLAVPCLQDMMVAILDVPTRTNRILSSKRCCHVQMI